MRKVIRTLGVPAASGLGRRIDNALRVSEPSGTLRRSALLALGTTGGYLAVSQYVIWLNDPVNAGAGFWPAAGITLAALLVMPRRHWWMVVCGVLLAETGGDLAQGYPLGASILWALANVVEPVVGATLIRRFNSSRGRLVPVRNVLVLVVCGAVLAPMVGGVIGSYATVQEFGAVWSQVWPKWVAGDGLGVLVMAPPLLAWSEQRSARRSRIEGAGVLLLLVATSGLAFRNWGHEWDVILPYLIVPAMIWAALRFGVRGAALAGLLVAQAANLATGLGYGPFSLVHSSASHAVTLLQIFLAITLVSALILGSLSADLTDRRETSRLLTHQANHDPLTGLPNRLALQRHLDRAVARSHPDCSTAVMFLDLDGFKIVNDSLGHSWGDVMLVQIAERLRAAARPRDLVARIGGDEFVVVAYDLARADDALPIARRLLDAVGEPVTNAGRTLVASASIGIALTDGVTSAEEVLRNADGAMYRAKRQGRNQIDFFDDALHQQAMSQLDLERDLRHALVTDELCLHYQAVVDLAEPSPVAYEALLRWQHPQRGLLHPSEFLEAADSDLVAAIGAWVVSQALSDLAASPDAAAISINVSTSQLTQDRGEPLSELLPAACAAHGIAPARVWIELTQDAVLHRPEAAATLGRLKDAGMRLALDHFGTGYASLDQLRSVPFDVVKLDPSLLDRPSHGTKGHRQLAAVIELVHAHGMTCIAEQVERPDQLDRLREAGCDLFQGPLLGRAGPLDSLLPRQAAGRLPASST